MPRAHYGHQDAETDKLIYKSRFRRLKMPLSVDPGLGAPPRPEMFVTAEARWKNVSLARRFSG